MSQKNEPIAVPINKNGMASTIAICRIPPALVLALLGTKLCMTKKWKVLCFILFLLFCLSFASPVALFRNAIVNQKKEKKLWTFQTGNSLLIRFQYPQLSGVSFGRQLDTMLRIVHITETIGVIRKNCLRGSEVKTKFGMPFKIMGDLSNYHL